MSDDGINKIIIEGTIRGKQRPRVTRTGIAYTPAQTVSYENWIKLCYKNQCGEYFDEPVSMSLALYYKVPKSYTKKKQKEILEGNVLPTNHQDVDNVIKIVGDALNKIAYPDDSYVTDIFACKRFTFENERLELILTPALKHDL